MRLGQLASSVSVLGVFSNHCSPVIAEKRIFIKFCFNTEHSASKFYDMIKKVFHDENMNITQAFEWYSCFESGKISTQGFNVQVAHNQAALMKESKKIIMSDSV